MLEEEVEGSHVFDLWENLAVIPKQPLLDGSRKLDVMENNQQLW